MEKSLLRDVQRSTTVEVLVKGTIGGKFNFPDDTRLKNALIVGLEVFRVSEVTASPSNKTPVADSVLLSSYLTLVANNNEEIIQNMPLAALVARLNEGRKVSFDNLRINLGQCLVNVPAGVTTVDGTVFVFTFYYQTDPKAQSC